MLSLERAGAPTPRGIAGGTDASPPSRHRSGAWHGAGTLCKPRWQRRVPTVPCHPAPPLPGPVRPRPLPLAPVLGVPSGCRCCCITGGGGKHNSPTGREGQGGERLQAQGFVHGFCRVHGSIFPGICSGIRSPGEVAPGLKSLSRLFCAPWLKPSPVWVRQRRARAGFRGRERRNEPRLHPFLVLPTRCRSWELSSSPAGEGAVSLSQIMSLSLHPTGGSPGAPVPTHPAALHPACPKWRKREKK